MFSSLLLFAQNPDDTGINLLKKIQEEIGQIGPSAEGSEEEQNLHQYILDFAQLRNLQIKEMDLDKGDENHSFSKNILVTLSADRDWNLFIVQRTDSESKTDNPGINLVLALSLMDRWAHLPAPVNLHFLFVSADSRERDFLGSGSFLDQYPLRGNNAVLYLQLDHADMIPEIYGNGSHFSTASWYLRALGNAFQDHNAPFVIDNTSFLLNRSGLQIKDIPLSLYLQEEMPAITLLSSEKRGVNSSLDMYLQVLNGFISNFRWAESGMGGNNYFVLVLPFTGTSTIFIREIHIILIFIFLISLSLMLPLFNERKIYLNFKRFRSQFWYVPLIIYLSFTFFLISTLMLEELLVLLGQNNLWTERPLYFFLLKIISALFLSSLFLNLLRGLPFPRNPHFYSYFAYLTSCINLIIATLFNLALGIVFLISLIFVFLFVYIKRESLKRIFMILSILPPFIVLFSIFAKSYTDIHRVLLFSRVWGNWAISSVILPLICMISSLSLYHHHYSKSRRELRTAFATLAFGLCTVSMVYIVFSMESPHAQRRTDSIFIQDTQNLNSDIREILIQSRTPLGAFTIEGPDKQYPVDIAGTEFKISGSIDPEAIDIQWLTRDFRGRRIYEFQVDASRSTKLIDISFSSETPLLLYDSPFPYEMDPDNKSGRIIIGPNPPLPLDITIIFSRESAPDFHIELQVPGSSYRLLGLERDVLSFSTISRSITFEELTASQ